MAAHLINLQTSNQTLAYTALMQPHIQHNVNISTGIQNLRPTGSFDYEQSGAVQTKTEFGFIRSLLIISSEICEIGKNFANCSL